jgi:hypothetical protein
VGRLVLAARKDSGQARGLTRITSKEVSGEKVCFHTGVLLSSSQVQRRISVDLLTPTTKPASQILRSAQEDK